MLFFGCRNSTGDFYYSQEWEGMEAEGVLAPGGLVTAFSRDQPAKVYVTHRIRERAATLWALLQEQGERGVVGVGVGVRNAWVAGAEHCARGPAACSRQVVGWPAAERPSQLCCRCAGAAVYVAGSADKMPAQVAAAFEDVAVQAGGLSAEAAARWLRQLEAAGRYQVEAWS